MDQITHIRNIEKKKITLYLIESPEKLCHNWRAVAPFGAFFKKSIWKKT